MKKKVILVLIVAIISVVLVYGVLDKQEEETNANLQPLLSNPGFEELNKAGKPESWVEDSKEGWFVDTDEPYEERISMEITIAWSSLYQEIAVEPEGFYKLKAYVKSDIKDRENVLLTLECLDKDGKVLEEEYGITTVTSLWQIKESSILAPEDTRKIRIKLAKRLGEGSVWFDGVELKGFPAYMRIKLLRGILLEDRPFFVFYFLMYALLIFSFLKLLFKKQKE